METRVGSVTQVGIMGFFGQKLYENNKLQSYRERVIIDS